MSVPKNLTYPRHQKAGTFAPHSEDCKGVEAVGDLAGFGLSSSGKVWSVMPHRIRFKDDDVPKLNLFPSLGQITVVNVVSDIPGLTADGVREAACLPELSSFGIQNRLDIGDDFAEWISTKTKLNEFRAFNTRISDIGIEQLVKGLQLETLGVSGHLITDSSVAALCNATTLVYLGIDGTSISKSGYERLRETLPHCTIKW